MIQLVLGDWSSDGHGKTETVNVESNLNHKEVEKAYKAGSKIAKVDITEELAADYEDNSVPEDMAKKLKEVGIDVKKLFDDNGESAGCEGFAELYMQIAKLGNKELKYKFQSYMDRKEIKIGGYGLFFD